MPIMCFFIAEGFQRTRNVKLYAGRLLVFALIAEIPFRLYFNYQQETGNVLFTLLAGLLFLWAWRDIKIRPLAYIVMALIMAAVNIPGYKTDYGALGVAMVALAGLPYHIKFQSKFQALAPAALCGLSNVLKGLPAPLGYWPLVAGLLLCLYNGKRGLPMKYFFYAFYPLHLVILWVVRWYIM